MKRISFFLALALIIASFGLAGANSIFYGDKLLTTDNPDENHDLLLFEKLGINIDKSTSEEKATHATCACA